MVNTVLSFHFLKSILLNRANLNLFYRSLGVFLFLFGVDRYPFDDTTTAENLPNFFYDYEKNRKKVPNDSRKMGLDYFLYTDQTDPQP